jgi:glucokinase
MQTCLLADVGGTNARFALLDSNGAIGRVQTLACAAYPELALAVQDYLRQQGAAEVAHAVIAIANPIDGDRVSMTNHHWTFSIEATRQRLGFATLLVVNDFTALAMAVPNLSGADLRQVGGGSARHNGVIGLVGAGTGLGVAGLVPSEGRWLPLQSEGGHASFSPSDERELTVLRHAWRHYPHVSAERLVSGPGIALTYRALAGDAFEDLATGEIVARALAQSDPLCMQAIDCFCGMLGTVAGNLAVTLCAHGGIYIGGGVAPRLGRLFARSPFRERFENKGRFSAFNAQIPTLLICAPYPALQGAAAIMARHLGQDHLLESLCKH